MRGKSCGGGRREGSVQGRRLCLRPGGESEGKGLNA